MKFATFLKKVTYFLTASIVFSAYKQTLRLNKFKTITTMNTNFSVFVICVDAIICLLIYNLHDCTFKIPLKIRKKIFWYWILKFKGYRHEVQKVCKIQANFGNFYVKNVLSKNTQLKSPVLYMLSANGSISFVVLLTLLVLLVPLVV